MCFDCILRYLILHLNNLWARTEYDHACLEKMLLNLFQWMVLNSVTDSKGRNLFRIQLHRSASKTNHSLSVVLLNIFRKSMAGCEGTVKVWVAGLVPCYEFSSQSWPWSTSVLLEMGGSRCEPLNQAA